MKSAESVKVGQVTTGQIWKKKERLMTDSPIFQIK